MPNSENQVESNELDDPNTVDMDFNEINNDELLLFAEIPIVISASRKEEPINSLSVPVSIVTAEDIHYSGLTNVPEIVQFLPGVDMARVDRNRYAVGIRGLHDVRSDRMQTLINGRLADSAVFGGCEWFRLPLLMEDISRIEVVRGPGGSAWGANAITGVINIITKDPEDITPGWLANTSWNHFGDNYSSLRWADQKDKWSWRASFGYEQFISSDEVIDDAKFDSSDFARDRRIDTHFNYNASDTTHYSFGSGYSYLRAGDWNFYGSASGETRRFETLRNFARMDHEFDNGSILYLQYTLNWSETQDQIMMHYSALENDIESQMDFQLNEKNKLSIGGNVRMNRITIASGHVPGLYFLSGAPINEVLTSFFMIDRYQYSDKLTFEAQVRTEWFNKSTFDWASRLSALYTIDKKTEQIFRLSTAKSFRAPSSNLREGIGVKHEIPSPPFPPDLYLLNLIMPEDDLKNEETWSIEAGYTGRLVDWLVVRIDTYYQRFERLIGYNTLDDPYGVRHIHQVDNIDGADSYGTELELIFSGKNWKLTPWYAYNDFVTDRSRQQLRSFLPATHKVGLSGRIHLKDNWVINSNYRWTSLVSGAHNNFLDSTNGAPSHRLDLSLSKSFNDDNAEIMIGIIDIFNRYNKGVTAVSQLEGHATPGRIVFARLQLKF